MSAASVPPPPPGLLQGATVTSAVKARQRRDPQKWCLSLGQFNAVIDHIKSLDAYNIMKASKGFVSLHDINHAFIKPWTVGTGCGLAVLMTGETEPEPDLMISHSWSECAEELHEALKKHAHDEPKITEKTMIWFCVFANYQGEDRAGPSIKEQLAQHPFDSVIKSEKVRTGLGMVVIHTYRDDLYSRLWCVHELHQATTQDVPVKSAMSDKFRIEMNRRTSMFYKFGYHHDQIELAAGVSAHTIKARCGRPSDEEMIVEQVAKNGGFEAMDETVRAFRFANLPQFVTNMIALAKIRHPDEDTACKGIKELLDKVEEDPERFNDFSVACTRSLVELEAATVGSFAASKTQTDTFPNVDENGDGFIERDEWANAFKRMDEQGTGAITRGQWYRMSEESKVFDLIPRNQIARIRLDEWIAAFDRLDTDGDGKVSLQEWQMHTFKTVPADDEWHASTDVYGVLARCLLNHELADVRCAAAVGLARLAQNGPFETPVSAVLALKTATGDVSRDVQEDALKALRTMAICPGGASLATPVLVSLFEEDMVFPEERIKIVEAFGELGQTLPLSHVALQMLEKAVVIGKDEFKGSKLYNALRVAAAVALAKASAKSLGAFTCLQSALAADEKDQELQQSAFSELKGTAYLPGFCPEVTKALEALVIGGGTLARDWCAVLAEVQEGVQDRI